MPRIEVTGPDGRFSAYMAKPKGFAPDAAAAGILVIQEIFGINAVMREICDGLAARGFLALCPDLFWRQEPGVDITDKTEAEWQKAFQLLQGFDADRGVKDLTASLDHLRRLPECTGKVGTVGYCLGGKLAYLMATRSTADCNVSYYGVGIETLLAEASAIKKPLLVHIAAEDKYVPKEAQEAIKQALTGNRSVSLHVYPGVDHAFAREGGQHWNAGAADLANQRSAEFLQRHLS